MSEVLIDAIHIGPRYRKDMGDIDALAASIKELGLLQPIGITADCQLIWGERRLRAYQLLGLDTIPARTVSMEDIVLGEYAENSVRKDFTMSERVEIGEAVEVMLGNRQGQRTDLPSDQPPEKFPEVNEGIETRDIAADRAGFGNGKTFEQAKSVIDKAVPEVVAAMDNEKLSINAAYLLSSRDPDIQKAIATKMNEDPRATTVRNADRIIKEETLKSASDDWTDSQRERRQEVEQGLTVVASQRTSDDGKPMDAALIVWAKEQGKLVEIDRGTAWGNPFELPGDGDRKDVCGFYMEHYLPYKSSLLVKLPKLKGKVLLCWCHPEQCHGDILAELANHHDS